MSDDSKEAVNSTLSHGKLTPNEEENAKTWINAFSGVRRTRHGEESAHKTIPPYAPLIKSKKGI